MVPRNRLSFVEISPSQVEMVSGVLFIYLLDPQPLNVPKWSEVNDKGLLYYLREWSGNGNG